MDTRLRLRESRGSCRVIRSYFSRSETRRRSAWTTYPQLHGRPAPRDAESGVQKRRRYGAPSRVREDAMAEFSKLSAFIDRVWDQDILPALDAYIRIPNKSPAFDADWQAHGYMDQAVDLLAGWAKHRLTALPGATLEVV